MDASLPTDAVGVHALCLPMFRSIGDSHQMRSETGTDRSMDPSLGGVVWHCFWWGELAEDRPSPAAGAAPGRLRGVLRIGYVG